MDLGSHNSSIMCNWGLTTNPVVWGASLSHSVGDLCTKKLEVLLQWVPHLTARIRQQCLARD